MLQFSLNHIYFIIDNLKTEESYELIKGQIIQNIILTLLKIRLKTAPSRCLKYILLYTKLFQEIFMNEEH